ncbi:MAG: MarR family EPS-associated transcriptional regulator [Candidatus Omnitrophota bacterium]|nr:MarR family EPS-associated transcriptional regulator [Candidatus Omnitrophota bacterium]
MNEHPPKEEILHIIKEIDSNSAITQRNISDKLGISLGKTNYLLNALIEKGIVKYKSFSENPGKISKIQYSLTKKGLEERIRLMHLFLKIKEEEYNKIRQEWESLNANGNSSVLKGDSLDEKEG